MTKNTNEIAPVREMRTDKCEPVCESWPFTASEHAREQELRREPDESIAFAPSEARAGADAATAIPSSSPFGCDGCRTDRDARGRFRRGNLARLVVGDRSAAFWRAADDAQRAIVRAVVTDAGNTESDAPKALMLAATSIAQSALIRDSAFARMIESGGALSSAGRARRSFLVWQSAVDRLERNLRLVGLRRVPRSAQSFAEALSNAEVLAGQPRGDEAEHEDQESESDAER
jgi:hypothetical protein